jgi:transaldolase
MMNNPLIQLYNLGQRIWLDNISRTILNDGSLARWITDYRIAGVTSNPSIFLKAFRDSPEYRDELNALKQNAALTSEQRYETLAISDIQQACDLFDPIFKSSNGNDGYVSLEVSPALAHDASGTIAAGLRLRQAVAKDNLLIKVPATSAGLVAIEGLIAEGCSVNVTLIFSLKQVQNVAIAYTRGIQQLIAKDGNPARVRSVASVFLSRIDTMIDQQLSNLGGDALSICGQTAIAISKVAMKNNRTLFSSEHFESLAQQGAHPQKLLWASTGTKNKNYSDVLYVESVIGEDTINTVPDATLAAFRDHGKPALTLKSNTHQALDHLDKLHQLGIDLDACGETLQKEGLLQFEESFEQLLAIMK